MLDQVCFLQQKFSLFILLFLATNSALFFEDEAAPKSLSGKQQKNILPISSSWEVLAGQQSSPVASCRLVAGGHGGLRKAWKSAPTLLGDPLTFSPRSHPIPRSICHSKMLLFLEPLPFSHTVG